MAKGEEMIVVFPGGNGVQPLNNLQAEMQIVDFDRDRDGNATPRPAVWTNFGDKGFGWGCSVGGGDFTVRPKAIERIAVVADTTNSQFSDDFGKALPIALEILGATAVVGLICKKFGRLAVKKSIFVASEVKKEVISGIRRRRRS